jgi:hypothetical protein
MNRQTGIAIRASLILAAAATTAACIGNSGPLGFASKRTTTVQSEQAEPDITGTVPARPTSGRPIAASAQNPPPSHVEIRAACWREFENAAADLDTKTALTRACVERRTSR